MLKVYRECCSNCLFSKDRIVSKERMKEIISDCLQNQRHFICHTATMNEEKVVCKTFYDKLGHKSQMVRIAERLNAIEFVEQPTGEW